MAGELTVTKRTFENSTMASKQRRWRVQYSRCFSYPSAYISSHTLNNDNTNHLSLSVLDKNRFVPTWLSTGGSSTVSLQPSEYSPALSVFAVSLLDTVLEEHYVSKLSFAWPQVKCHSGFPTRGSLTLIASYYDSFGEKQKFALRFTTSRDIENFITSLEDLFSDILPELPSAVDVMSAVSSQSEFIPPYRPDTSSIMDPIYASSEPTNFYDENLQESQSQTQSIVAYSENNNAAFPPSFTSLISGCYADPDQNALNLTLVSDIQEPDLKARIARDNKHGEFIKNGVFDHEIDGVFKKVRDFNYYCSALKEDKLQMACLKISSFLCNSARLLPQHGKTTHLRRAVSRYSTNAALQEPITAPVKVKYTQLFVNGQFVDSASGKKFTTCDPRTGNVIAEVAEGDAEDINRAVLAARRAFDEGPWPKMTAYERSKILLKFADLLDQHTEEIAALETWDNGKPYEQAAKVELPMCSRVMRYYAGWTDKIHGLTAPADGPYHVQTLHEPIGVVGQIIPWNFPLLMFVWKIGPALATGNTIIMKSAEQTPLTALYAAKLLQEAGLPDGVLNIVSGYGPTAGAALASHMDVDKLAFTGSTETGKLVLGMAAESNLKPVTLELGGKSPFIVCKDADVDKAVELAHFALFFNQGQCCCAGSRTYVHESVYDEFVAKAKARAIQRVVGDPFRKDIEQGPQIDSEQFEKVMSYIKSGINSGATLETGGERYGSEGFYIQPTVFSNVKEDMLIAQDEIFGPVQSILKFNDLQDVIRRANATQYGLAAGIFTQDLDTANTLARALRVGSVWVNCFDIFDAAIPFGGYKMSGQGREKGIYSLMNYLQVKAVVTSLKNPAWL